MSERTDRPAIQAPATIQPNSIYSLAQAAALLGLAKNCLPREIRLRRLRVSKRAGRYMILGEWLLEWIKGGEMRPTHTHEPSAGANGAHSA